MKDLLPYIGLLVSLVAPWLLYRQARKGMADTVAIEREKLHEARIKHLEEHAQKLSDLLKAEREEVFQVRREKHDEVRKAFTMLAEEQLRALKAEDRVERRGRIIAILEKAIEDAGLPLPLLPADPNGRSHT